MDNNFPPNKSFCLAPWLHAFITPAGNRKLCCISGEPDYGSFDSLNEYRNGEFAKSVRLKMLKGETIEACKICDQNTFLGGAYKNYFNDLFKNDFDEYVAKTRADGTIDLPVLSYDYRTSNSCNFKCRMCTPEYSSQLEEEVRQNSGDNALANWLKTGNKETSIAFQKNIVEPEFYEAIEQQPVREIYWAGGEPLVLARHWQSMQRLVENGKSKNLKVRYNSNLSVVDYKGINIFKDILPHFSDVEFQASIDATGVIGEYLRKGLVWEKFKSNILQAKSFNNNSNHRVLLDITMTNLGLLDLENMISFVDELGIPIRIKLVGSRPDEYLSPLFFDEFVKNYLIDHISKRALPKARDSALPFIAFIEKLKQTPTFEFSYPENFMQARRWAKHRCNFLDGIRYKDGSLAFEAFWHDHPVVLDWWNKIER